MAIKPIEVAHIAALGVGTLLHAVALFTNSWMSGPHKLGAKMTLDANNGLFRLCKNGQCGPIDSPTGWLRACQVTGVLGLLAGLGAAGSNGLIFKKRQKGEAVSQQLVNGSLGTAAASTLFILLCVIIYKFNEELSVLGYSYWLSFAGGVVNLGGSYLIYTKRAQGGGGAGSERSSASGSGSSGSS